MVLLVGGVTVSAQVLADKKALPLATAKKMAEAAEKFAIQQVERGDLDCG